MYPKSWLCIYVLSEANKFFVEYISKAYQALTDPISKENFEKYGHPDGKQVTCCLKPSTNLINILWEILKLSWSCAGISNGYRSSSVPAGHRWCFWWNSSTLDCGRLYSFATSYCRDIPLKVIKVYWKLCHASYTVQLLSLNETFFGPEVCGPFWVYVPLVLLLYAWRVLFMLLDVSDKKDLPFIVAIYKRKDEIASLSCNFYSDGRMLPSFMQLTCPLLNFYYSLSSISLLL